MGDDWDDFEGPRTAVDGAPVDDEAVFPEPPTGKHRSTEFLAGRERGFTDGIAACARVLRDMLRSAGLSEEQVHNIALKMRLDAEKLG